MSSTHVSMYAYDLLDRVQITIRVAEVPEDPTQRTIWNVLVSVDIPSTGETDTREWLRDVLVAALEAT